MRDRGSAVAAQREASSDADRDFLNYIRDVEAYATPDGGSVSVPAYYDRVLTNGQGDYVLTGARSNLMAAPGESSGWLRE